MAREKEPAWARIDVDYLRNKKVAPLPDRAVLAHLAAITWCKEQGTNGHVPSDLLHVILTRKGARSGWNLLENAGLTVREPDGWTIVGFDERNGDEAARELAREYERTRKADQRANRNVP